MICLRKQSRRGFRSFWKARRATLGWVVWPGMFGIAAAEVFSHLVVCGRPETLQIVRDLHGPIIRAENVQQDRHSSPGDSRRFQPAEKLLQTDGEDWRPPRFISEPRLSRAGQ